MPESIKQTSSIIRDLSEARVIQALLVIIVTIGIMVMYVTETPISSELSYIWMFLVGLYMELPSKISRSSVTV